MLNNPFFGSSGFLSSDAGDCVFGSSEVPLLKKSMYPLSSRGCGGGAGACSRLRGSSKM